jgi:hypothetical protein
LGITHAAGEEKVKSCATAITLISLMFCTSSLSAGIIPGRWEKVAALNPETEIVITLKSGERTESYFVSLGSDKLVVREITGIIRELPKTEVLGIVTEKKISDGKLNGILIGAGVGFGAGFLGLAAWNARETASGPIWDREALGYYTGAGLIMAAVGAVAGSVIDAAHKDQEVLYVAR